MIRIGRYCIRIPSCCQKNDRLLISDIKLNRIVSYLVSRPPSRLSTASVVGDSAAPGMVTPSAGRGATPLLDVDPAPAIEEEALDNTVAEEGVKLSILAKGKAIEDQVITFVILIFPIHNDNF